MREASWFGLGPRACAASAVPAHGHLPPRPCTRGDSWRASGVWDRLQTTMQLLVEPTEAGAVEGTLRAHEAACSSPDSAAPSPGAGGGPGAGSAGPPPRRGSLLLAVVGGRLAEGINFGDELGRCVMMVGLPFPNPSDPELQERLRCLRSQSPAGADPAHEHCLDLCMRAVNQGVGRAIRHARDYASVLLLDAR